MTKNDPGLKLTLDQVTAMCQRAFGHDMELESMHELGGGTYNETYRIELAGGTRAILRAAPIPAAGTCWDDKMLMRREHHVQPFFASIATLMPKIVLADFTHQLVDRDFMFQSVVEGERWSDINDELTPDENISLWRQCGEIVRRMHDTTGEQFGYPYPGCQHARWSETILDRFARISKSMLAHKIEIPGFTTVSDIAHGNVSLFDEIRTPRLLHGDLWTFNLLVTRSRNGPTITGVLDADRAWWGDPEADCIMFLLAIRRDKPEWQHRLSAFYDGYGTLENGKATRFRREAYRAMHVGEAAVWYSRNGDEESLPRARRELREIAQTLSLLSQ